MSQVIFPLFFRWNLILGRKISADHVADLCEGGFFDVSLIIGSISELLSLPGEEVVEKNRGKIYLLQGGVEVWSS